MDQTRAALRNAAPALRRRLSRQIVLSALALIWERFWPAAWSTLAVVGVFAIIGVFGLWALMPWWLHAMALIGLSGALVWALWDARRRFRLPSRVEAIRRLERNDRISHRPLTTALDTPAIGEADDRARLIWQAHQRRMARLLDRLKVAWPAPGLAQRDPHALRAVIILLLVIGFAGAGGQAWSRMTAGLEPNFERIGAVPPGRLTAWIDQPAYTGLPPVFLTDLEGSSPGESADHTEAIDVVEGGVLFARVHGGAAAPLLRLGETERSFDVVDAANSTVEAELVSDGTLAIVQDGRSLGEWDIRIIIDQPPEIALASELRQTENAVLRLEYRASDDYGLARATMRAFRDGIEDDADPIEVDLSLPGVAPRKAKQSGYHDLTAHPWAGLLVLLELTAADTGGQIGRSALQPVILPEREFEHPVAIALIDQRQKLALDHSRATAVRAALSSIMKMPEARSGDTAAYLGIRSAYARLDFPQDKQGLYGIFDLLWDVALRYEDGDLSLAERALREAQEALLEALESGAPPEELAELMKNLQARMNEYLELMQQNDETASTLEETDRPWARDESLQRTRNDLQQLLDSANDMAMTGARESAKQMLKELQELLENLAMRPNPQPNALGGQPLMEDLREIMSNQDQLLDDTFREAQERSRQQRLDPGEAERDRTGAERQENLRRALGELMRQLGERGQQIPDELGRAERLMGAARDDLMQGRPDRAVEPQAEALQQLQEGAEAVMNQMMAGQPGDQRGRSGMPMPSEELRDPFGRLPPDNGSDPTGFVELPTKSDVQRSREILQELRRRAGERHRPQPEQDYIDRLLHWY